MVLEMLDMILPTRSRTLTRTARFLTGPSPAPAPANAGRPADRAKTAAERLVVLYPWRPLHVQRRGVARRYDATPAEDDAAADALPAGRSRRGGGGGGVGGGGEPPGGVASCGRDRDALRPPAPPPPPLELAADPSPVGYRRHQHRQYQLELWIDGRLGNWNDR